MERFGLELLLDHSVVFLDARRHLTLTVLLSNKAPVHWVDKAFHWINSRLVDSRYILLTLISWVATNTLDSATFPSNSGLMCINECQPMVRIPKIV